MYFYSNKLMKKCNIYIVFDTKIRIWLVYRGNTLFNILLEILHFILVALHNNKYVV